MHVVDLLEEAMRLAMNSGFEVRQEWLNERGGGICRVGEKQIVFVDLSLTAKEQLEQLVADLRQCPTLKIQGMNSPELRQLLASPISPE